MLRNHFFVVRVLSADALAPAAPVVRAVRVPALVPVVRVRVPVALVPVVLILVAPVLDPHGVIALIVGAIVAHVVTVPREAIVVLAVTALPVVIVDQVVRVQTRIVEEDKLFVSEVVDTNKQNNSIKHHHQKKPP